ncbi:MAG TPA: DUF2794 domain-containing protein [Stellaceae bacterium]|nr:DUF2794 domain-containing protein [Stellaceae bacterium]
MTGFLQTPERPFSSDSDAAGLLDFGREMGKTDVLNMPHLREPSSRPPMATVIRLSDHRRQRRVFFSRAELDQLLQIYSREVVRGVWRDYAIDQREGTASFSVFRHSLESPLFTVVKSAPGESRYGPYALLHRRARLAAGSTLLDVLAKLEREVRRNRRLTDAPAMLTPG